MSNTVLFEKVLALPETLVPGTLYAVQSQLDSNYIDLYISTNDGLGVKKIWGIDDTTNAISAAFDNTNLTNITIVETIEERNSLAPIKPIFVLVKDATSDQTVTSGAASYVYDPNIFEWIKLSEFESLDIDFNWDFIKNKPNSLVSEIDDAVSKKHSHQNQELLNSFSEDNNLNLLFKGAPVGSAIRWSKEEW